MQAALQTNLPQHEQITFTLKSNTRQNKIQDYKTIFAFVPAATRFCLFISKSIQPRAGHKMSVFKQLHFHKEALPNRADGNDFRELHTNPRICEWTDMTS